MVQKSRSINLFWHVLVLICLLFCALVVSLWTEAPFEIFLKTSLPYQGSGGFFDLDISSALLGIILSWVFLSSIILATLGGKLDHIFSGILLLFSFFLFSQSGNPSSSVYLSLIIIAILGNIIGFGLKFARQGFFKNSWIGR